MHDTFSAAGFQAQKKAVGDTPLLKNTHLTYACVGTGEN